MGASRTSARKPTVPDSRSRATDDSTRNAVIEATLDTICDLGYYKASSNEIARRADVTWGVIQYYFGTREGLLTAVLEEAVDGALTSLDSVHIVGSDRRMRLRQLHNLVLSYYGNRRYVAVLQILWNLSRDPRTTDATEESVVRHSTKLISRWRTLLADAFEETLSDEAVWMAFTLMWGVAMEQAANEYISRPFTEVGRPPIEYRIEMTLDALEGMIERDRR
ncbi:TetR/AcrR family transcriptional regulator [Rhodococcus koreensis]